MAKRTTTTSGTKVRTTTLWSHVLLLAAILSGCAAEVESASQPEMSGVCMPGEPFPCNCSNGQAGTQTCAPDGASVTACSCEPASLGTGGGSSGSGGSVAGTGGSPPAAGGTLAGTGGTLAGTGGGGIVIPASGGSEGVEPPSERQAMVDAFTCPGGTIVPGTNTLMVNGRARTLVADFPADTNRRMGILFSWHGYNQAEGQHREASNLNPDENPALPVVVITPDDLEFELPVGLDWQLDEGSVESNVDLQFFEAMVGCLNQQYDIDPARIHSLGYSAGSVMTALLHSVYPQIVRNVIAISGMWFNDQAEIDAIIFAGAVLTPTWPALRPEDGGTILLTHGGLGDIAAVIINLETMAQKAFPFLAQADRAVIDCAHSSGHTGHPEVGPGLISRFISDNPSDAPSPYLSGGYAGWPGSCTLRMP